MHYETSVHVLTSVAVCASWLIAWTSVVSFLDVTNLLMMRLNFLAQCHMIPLRTPFILIPIRKHHRQFIMPSSYIPHITIIPVPSLLRTLMPNLCLTFCVPAWFKNCGKRLFQFKWLEGVGNGVNRTPRLVPDTVSICCDDWCHSFEFLGSNTG